METIQEAIQQARNDLAVYASLLWPPFQLPRHLRLLVEQLERVERGEIDRLMIYMPPRHGKSITASQLFPAYYLGRHPDRSIITATYAQELSLDFGRRVRSFISDQIHREIFPRSIISDDNASAHRLGLSAGGSYYSVGRGGAITGRGAHVFLIDDAVKNREEAFSEAERRSLRQWYEHVAYSRLEPGGAIIIIATRWHEDDLPGFLLREHADENWQVISLPAIAEPFDLLGRPEGAALWPARYPLTDLERTRSAIGSSAWLAMYQQRPAPEEGGIFQRDWFLSYPARERPECGQVVMSLDTAYKTGATNDFSVIEVWGVQKDAYLLLAVWRERKEFGELMKQAVIMAERWAAQLNSVLIEDAASGMSLIQMLQRETRLPVLPVKSLGDKVTRAHAVSPLVESGKVFLPDQAHWLRDFLDEVTSFPAAPHDDIVDSMTQALAYLREHMFPESYRWSGLPRYERPLFGGRVSGFTARGGPEADDALEDMREGNRGGAFIHSSEQMRALSSLNSDRVRWPTFSRRRAW